MTPTASTFPSASTLDLSGKRDSSCNAEKYQPRGIHSRKSDGPIKHGKGWKAPLFQRPSAATSAIRVR